MSEQTNCCDYGDSACVSISDLARSGLNDGWEMRWRRLWRRRRFKRRNTLCAFVHYEKHALNIAIDEEYRAKATYLKVIATFGPISPFPCIANCEQKHINAVASLLTKYGLPIPQDPWTGHITIEFTSKQQACEVGAQAEIDNAAVYDQMIPQIAHSDIISTFSMLRDVSRYKHLPAFQNWAAIYASLNQ